MAFGVMALSVTTAACEPERGKLRERIERSNGQFRVAIDIFDEGNMAHFFEPGCHVSFLSAPVGSDDWRQFTRAYFSHRQCDENLASLSNRVRFVNDRVAYVFLQYWYGVTIDGGQTWSPFDVATQLQGRVYPSPRLIEDVSIDSDGTGTMSLDPDAVVEKKRLILQTEDFGRQWSLQ